MKNARKVAVLGAVVLAVFTSSFALAQGEGQNITANLNQPEYQTRDGLEKVAQLVLSGKITVDVNGNMRPTSTVSHPSGIGRSEARRIANRVAQAEAAKAQANARKHADVVAGEAVRKANSYTESRVSGIESAIAGAATWGKWGVGMSAIALMATILVAAFLARRLSGPCEEY